MSNCFPNGWEVWAKAYTAFTVFETCAALKVWLWDPVRRGKRETDPVLGRGMSAKVEAVENEGRFVCSAAWGAGKKSSVGLSLSASMDPFRSVSSALTTCVIKASVSNEQDFMVTFPCPHIKNAPRLRHRCPSTV